jgi:hypothetical protein
MYGEKTPQVNKNVKLFIWCEWDFSHAFICSMHISLSDLLFLSNLLLAKREGGGEGKRKKRMLA